MAYCYNCDIIWFLMPPAKVNRRHIERGYLDKIEGFIKLGRLLSVTPF
jgi:hypothetical protein